MSKLLKKALKAVKRAKQPVVKVKSDTKKSEKKAKQVSAAKKVSKLEKSSSRVVAAKTINKPRKAMGWVEVKKHKFPFVVDFEDFYLFCLDGDD